MCDGTHATLIFQICKPRESISNLVLVTKRRGRNHHHLFKHATLKINIVYRNYFVNCKIWHIYCDHSLQFRNISEMSVISENLTFYQDR